MIKKKLDELSIEEFANTLTHGAGLLLSVAGFFILAVLAVIRGEAPYTAGLIIYGASLVILYAASTFYHGTTSPKLKKTLQVVDHCCIYLLIAGSYTPFGLVISGTPFGRWMLAGVWAFAVIGIGI